MNLFAHNKDSRGAAALCNALDIYRIKHRASTYRGASNKWVINWGSSRIPENVATSNIINSPEAVEIASNKLRTFSTWESSSLLGDSYKIAFGTTISWARAQLAGGHTVVARTILNGHSGNGIVIMDPEDTETHNVAAPLYVRYIPKKVEFRVHVFFSQIIDVQRKGLAEEFQGRTDINWQVRNLANGFIYAREGASIPQHAQTMAINAVNALGLDFGAVDIIYNERRGGYYPLEVNTAPGLVGTTVTKYADAIRNRFPNEFNSSAGAI